MVKLKAIYGIFMGACMIIMWSMLLITGQATELNTEPYRITAHLLSEFITALMLVSGGIMILKKMRNGNTLTNVALGALFYSVLTAGGYYLQKGDFVMVAMFGVFTVLTLCFIMNSVFGKRNHQVLNSSD